MLKIIAFCDKDNVMGVKGDDPKFLGNASAVGAFLQETKDKLVVMGRNTFEIIGPVPNSKTYVVSKNKKRFVKATRLESALDVVHLALKSKKDVVVLGSVDMLYWLLPAANELTIVRIPKIIGNKSDTLLMLPNIPSNLKVKYCD